MGRMQTIGAGRFKNVCLKLLDEVAATRTPIVITKRGRPVAQLVPYQAPDQVGSLAGSILRETGDPYGTGERWWDADQDAGGCAGVCGYVATLS